MDNMKNIKELGLELIELDDQVLLVDDKKLIINGYIQRGTEKPVINKPDFWFDFGVRYKNVIASTKPLEGLPLLVIEDEVEDIVGENLKRICSWETYQDHPIGRCAKQALQEHEKAKETFKFTEEDLRKALFIKHNGLSDDYIIEFLTKKELWIEVVFNSKYGQRGSWTYGDYELANKNLSEFMVVKITDGKIKAIWK